MVQSNALECGTAGKWSGPLSLTSLHPTIPVDTPTDCLQYGKVYKSATPNAWLIISVNSVHSFMTFYVTREHSTKKGKRGRVNLIYIIHCCNVWEISKTLPIVSLKKNYNSCCANLMKFLNFEKKNNLNLDWNNAWLILVLFTCLR